MILSGKAHNQNGEDAEAQTVCIRLPVGGPTFSSLATLLEESIAGLATAVGPQILQVLCILRGRFLFSYRGEVSLFSVPLFFFQSHLKEIQSAFVSVLSENDGRLLVNI